jgi:hypothetical protein
MAFLMCIIKKIAAASRKQRDKGESGSPLRREKEKFRQEADLIFRLKAQQIKQTFWQKILWQSQTDR